ncbi:universal stress protein [Pedobacter immunditicola]|uniref:universal stress protein n=1 Tax=Pedobacter immunditicola TaxID=3133440 RepID=UPI0030AE15F2
MKTVLVLTDFSTNAKQAAQTAVFLAGKLELKILLFNVYFSVPIVPAGINDAWSKSYDVFKKESETELQVEAARLTELFKNGMPGTPTPDIQYISAFGDLGDNTYKIIDERNIEFVVMGARKKQQNHILFGDDITDVLKKSKKPVLIVNEGFNLQEIKNIVLTTDLAVSDFKVVECLNRLSHKLQFQVHVAHVAPHADGLKEDERVKHFTTKINQLASENVSFHNLIGENVIEELVEFNAQLPADLLAIVQKRRSFLWNIFHESVSKEFISESKMSILIIPE